MRYCYLIFLYPIVVYYCVVENEMIFALNKWEVYKLLNAFEVQWRRRVSEDVIY
jgi:hypothetical protein